MKLPKKAVWGWALYDWANSAFATTVMAGFFPVFFKQYWSVGVDVNLSTARLGIGNAVAGLLVALAAPLLGAVADRGSARKRFLALFAYLGVLTTAALFFVGEGQWPFALVIYSLGVIGFSGANIFYDSLLPDVAEPGQLDMVSGLGYSMGYLGGGLLFLPGRRCASAFSAWPCGGAFLRCSLCSGCRSRPVRRPARTARVSGREGSCN
jgi:UMF1 family MFS transporter